jgi:hypothetical protein
VEIVYVTDFKSGTLTGQTTWPERGNTTLVRDLTQRIGLVQELRQLRSTKERIDHRAQRPGIDKVHRSEYLIVTDIHSLPDGTGHTSQTHPELSVQLLPNRPYTAVAQVIDIVDFSLGIRQTNKILDDLDHVFLRQRLLIQWLVQIELAVDLITAYFTKIIALVAKE